MSLATAGPGFTRCTSNITGTPGTAGPGTNFTAGASNADGTAVELIADLTHDVHFVVIEFGGLSTNTANGSSLADLLIDRAGGTSWSDFISDMIAGFTPVFTSSSSSSKYFFPVWIPAGSSLAVQARTAHTADFVNSRCAIWCYGEPRRPDTWWCGQKVESLGITAASSSGTNVTPGASGAAGTFTTIGTSTGRYEALQFGLNGSDAAELAAGYHWEMGYDSVLIPGTPTMYCLFTSTEINHKSGINAGPIFAHVPSGKVLQARATSSAASPEDTNVAIYGVI